MHQAMRSEVAESWHRSAAAGVDVGTETTPITVPEDDLGDYRAAHPLAPVYPLLDDVLGEAARACDALLALSDDEGQLLWVTGTAATLRRGESIGFVEGSNWHERVAGTNAPGTALVLDRPTTVVGAEHYRESVRPWNCVAAPIHDPSSGRIIGVLDVTGGPDVASPQTMAMVRAAARLAEAELARIGGPILVPDMLDGEVFVRAPITVQCLGRREAVLTTQGKAQVLTRRHSEVLALLATSPAGLTGDELGLLLYEGDGAGASTLRAEMNRLRGLLGTEVIGSRPYRLLIPVAGDWNLVRGLLSAGDVVAAMRHYAGPILPASEAPGVVAMRESLHGELREAVVSSRRADLMAAWTRASWGVDDYEVWTAQSELLPTTSPLRPLVRSQIARLDRELA
jgi:hypothetical protein